MLLKTRLKFSCSRLRTGEIRGEFSCKRLYMLVASFKAVVLNHFSNTPPSNKCSLFQAPLTLNKL